MPPCDPNLPIADLDSARSRVGGDEEVLRDLATFFLDDVPGLIGELRGALDAEDGDRAARAAHSLKGLASTFSASRAETAARELEKAVKSGLLDRARWLFPGLYDEFQQTIQLLETELLEGRDHQPPAV